MKKIYLGLGSDTGDRIKYISEAEIAIGDCIGKITKFSSIYETEPWGFISEHKFLNRVLEVETLLDPASLMVRILQIEAGMGRSWSNSGYESRIIDIDILLYGEEIINDASIVIPHPHLHERKFVLIPLNEVASDLVHPVFKKSIKVMLEECKDRSEVAIFNY